MCYVTIDAIGLGHEYKLVIAGELLIADDEGHPVFGVIKHFREGRLLPLQVEILKFNPRNSHSHVLSLYGNPPVKTNWKVDVGIKVPHYLNCQEGFCCCSLCC